MYVSRSCYAAFKLRYSTLIILDAVLEAIYEPAVTCITSCFDEFSSRQNRER